MPAIGDKENENMRKLRATGSLICLGMVTTAVVLIWTLGVSGHCQIPCGIYDDSARVAMLKEHATTVEKAMKQIKELSEDPGKNANQLIRWVQSKEDHADRFADIIAHYFLQQRIKPVAGPGKAGWDDYVQKLVLCHRMLLEAMKAKQTTDLEHVRQMRRFVADFHKSHSPIGVKDAHGEQGHSHGDRGVLPRR